MIVARVGDEETLVEDTVTDVSVQFDDPYERAYVEAQDEGAEDPEAFVEERVDEQTPEAWCNAAGVSVGDDQVRLWISTGDPRGAFSLLAYRTKDGEIRLEVPHEGMGFAHEDLEQVNDGLLVIKRTKADS